MEEEQWKWRNCRDLGFSVSVWPLNWTWPKLIGSADVFGGSFRFQIGPFDFAIEANDGSWRKSAQEHQP